MHDPTSDDALAIRWLLVHGVIRHDEADSKLGVWTCPLIRMHVLCVMKTGLIDTPPITPTVECGPDMHVRDTFSPLARPPHLTRCRAQCSAYE